MPWLYRHFSASALLTGVRFLISVSSSSSCETPLPGGFTAHLHNNPGCGTQIFQGFQALCCRAGSSALIGVRNHNLLKHLFYIRERSACCCGFEDVIAEETSHVHGILGAWPWVCCLTPTKISYSFLLYRKFHVGDCPRQMLSIFYSLFCLKFPV